MAQQLLPFRKGTRQRHYKVGVVPYAASAQGQPLKLPQVGMLGRLIVQLRGTITYSAPGTVTDEGPWNLISRIQLLTNIGAAVVYDASGYGSYLIDRTLARGWSPEVAGGSGGGSATPNADIYAFPVSGTAQAFVLTYEMPVSVNDGGNFETGLINLQAPETSVQVQINFGALTDPASLVTAIVANAHVYYEYYEIPNVQQYAMPPLALSRWLEESQAINATGDNIYTVPRMGTLLNLIHGVRLNGARSDSIDQLQIRFNKTDNPYTDERQWRRVEERRLYGLAPNVGDYYWDFFHAYGDINKGDTRDAINTEALTTLESVLTVSAGATLGSNNNALRTVRRILQIIQG